MQVEDHNAAGLAGSDLAAAGLQDTEQSQDLCSLQPLTSRCAAICVSVVAGIFPWDIRLDLTALPIDCLHVSHSRKVAICLGRY